jgi:ketosteroid isomerase-like protein
MSENLAKLKTLYEEWARGDYSRSDIFDPDMELEGFGMGDPSEARDYEGFLDAMRDWLSAWERPLTIEADEFIASGDRILALVRWRGRGKGSGAEMEAAGGHIWTFQDGLITRCEVYRDRDQARAALEAG